MDATRLDRALLRATGAAGRRSRQRVAPPPPPPLTADHLRGATLVPDRRALLELLPHGGSVAELGVDRGELSELILQVARPRKLHLVDPWGGRRYGEPKHAHVRAILAEPIASGRVEVHRTSSTAWLASCPPSSLDWVYVDTDHTYATTLAELRLAARVVRPDGVLAGHDFVTGNWISGYRYGVVEAVNRFCVEDGWRFVALTHEPDRHLSFALQRIPAG